jgi:CRP/FNR family transcriptional regulator, cyclic AMP receptor protein
MSDQPDFLGLSRNERVVITLQPGDVLFGEGAAGDRMYVVRSGTIRIGSGNTVYEDVEAGGIVGEMAIIEDAPRSASATALTACEVAEIDRKRFQYLVQQVPHFAVNVMKVLSRRLREMNERYRY